VATSSEKPSRPITQYDLAQSLGIGQKTVSRALAGDGPVSPKLRARIEAAAAELGYRPNQSARSIRSRRFDTAMLIQVVAKRHHRLAPGIIDGIADGLAEGGRALLIERLVLSEMSPDALLPRGLRQAMVDGLLVHADTDPAPAIEAAIAAAGLPIVWLNRRLSVNAVCPDDHGAAVMMVRRLAAAGHQRIAWLDFEVGYRPSDMLHYSRGARLDGYRSAMAEVGLPATVLTPTYEPGDVGHPAWLEARLRAERPSAVACYGGYEALAVIHIAGRMGLRIPEDLSLIMVHHESLVAGVRIDVAALPTETVGRAGAAMLVERLGGRKRCPSVAVPFTMILGATVVPPRS